VSATRPELTSAQLAAIAAAACPGDALVGSAPLTGGTYNAVHRLDLASGRSVVVKVAPPPDAPGLRYERELLRTEAMFYERAGALGDVPLPEVVHAGFDRTIVGSDLLVLTVIEGVQWLEAGPLDEDVQRSLRHHLGELVARLHGIRGERFGYPHEATGPLTDRWSSAFVGFVEAVLADAADHRVDLPVEAEGLREVVAAHVETLDQVEAPTLVHFDLWDGNLFVDPDAGRVTGIIDAERAFYGDPLADFVSLPLFGDPETEPGLLEGYRAAGGAVSFDDSARLRLALYRAYMDLLLLVEAAPRQQEGDPGMRRFFEQHLCEQVELLRRPS
jgi:aminoglycoside phosphotransferase (APT) family kinase protein